MFARKQSTTKYTQDYFTNLNPNFINIVSKAS